MTAGNDVQRHRPRRRATIGLAAATLALLAIGTEVEWMEHVTDEQYRGRTGAQWR
jgi:hypothetical protein